jgi:hypothetical protein
LRLQSQTSRLSFGRRGQARPVCRSGVQARALADAPVGSWCAASQPAPLVLCAPREVLHPTHPTPQGCVTRVKHSLLGRSHTVVCLSVFICLFDVHSFSSCGPWLPGLVGWLAFYVSVCSVPLGLWPDPHYDDAIRQVACGVCVYMRGRCLNCCWGSPCDTLQGPVGKGCGLACLQLGPQLAEAHFGVSRADLCNHCSWPCA